MIKINDVINTIIQGDCLNVLKEIESNSVDLIFADPPYNMQTEGTLLRTNGSEFDGVSDNWDKFESLKEYDEFCIKWLSECKRILKNDGAIWVIGSFQNIYRLGYIMQDLGFWILNDVIWSKPNAVPNFGGTRFQNAHETLLWCSRSKKSKYCFNYKTMKSLNGSKQMKSVWDIVICIGNERLKDKDGKKDLDAKSVKCDRCGTRVASVCKKCGTVIGLFRIRAGTGTYFMPFSYASIIFLTIWPPTEPAWRLVSSPL